MCRETQQGFITPPDAVLFTDWHKELKQRFIKRVLAAPETLNSPFERFSVYFSPSFLPVLSNSPGRFVRLFSFGYSECVCVETSCLKSPLSFITV